jgi:hypothetical protein
MIWVLSLALEWFTNPQNLVHIPLTHNPELCPILCLPPDVG